MAEISARSMGSLEGERARWLRGGSAHPVRYKHRSRRLVQRGGGVLPGLGGRAVRGVLAGAIALSRIIARRPCTCPQLRWISDANSVRSDSPMLMPSIMTSLAL